jgi:predicted transcriptional regulator of viral defense system
MNDLELYLKTHGLDSTVFTTSQMAALLGTGSPAAAVRLNRAVGKGVLVRLMRGRYSLPSAEPLCVASGLYAPSYVSLWAAFQYHGSTTQSPRVIDVMNTKWSGKIRIGLQEGIYDLHFIRTRPRMLFGYQKVNIGGQTATIAEKERAIIDGLHYQNLIPLDEVWGAIKSGIDVGRTIAYARKVGQQAVLKRLGCLLSMAGQESDPAVFGAMSKTYVPLDPALARRGKHDPRWRVIVNRVIG